MGVTTLRFLRAAVLLASLAPALLAAPMLRLSTTTVGPVSVLTASAGPAQVVEAYNAGDGTLNLQVSASVPWITATVGAARPCSSQSGTCLPIQIGPQTDSLPKGMRTGILTVSDPNAVDAPQSITVTVQVGGGVPDSVDLYVAPNGSAADEKFSTNSGLTGQVSTQDGRPWLTLLMEGVGTFSFVRPYRIVGRHLSGMAEGNYEGAIDITNSTFAPDNKNVPVMLHVTSQPIAEVSQDRMKFRIAQNVPKMSQYFVVTNRGLGNLSVTAVTPSTSSGGNWLSAENAGGTLYKVTADPAGVAPGIYQGSLAVSSNAANGTLTMPVELEVLAPGPPLAFFGGAVNIANYQSSEPVAKGDIVALFGEQFSSKDPEVSPALPLATELGGASVFVNDRAVPLYFSSYGQMNFQLPFDTPAGTALVRVERDGQRGNTISLKVADRAPRILPRGVGDYGIILVYAEGAPYAMPSATAAQYGLVGRPARSGEILIMYVVGMGPTSPPIAAGDAAPVPPPLVQVMSPPRVVFGAGPLVPGVSVQPAFAGLVPTLAGLYQINVVVPEGAPRGDVIYVHLESDGVVVSNRVTIAIE
jgi:uncharacterized protein (TIGR03437 family)